MNRPYYSEYVRHCLRFYTRNRELTQFKTEVDKNNWLSCASVLKKYSDTDQNIINLVYGSFDTISDNVYETAKKYEINQSIIWDMMKEIERKIAHRRGLI